MAIQMYMRPQALPVSWKIFCQETKPFSVALDGYVSTGPRFDKRGPRANFNHHEEVDRLATRSTCAQVYVAIRQDFFSRFTNASGEPEVHAFMLDCDEDICTARYLLRHGDRVGREVNQNLNRLVFMEDLLDTTAGAYPLPPDYPVLEELAWVFEPYRQFRMSGLMKYRSADDFERVACAVEERIDFYVAGKGKRRPLDMTFEIIGGGPHWSMVRELGACARTGIFAAGIRAYVSVTRREGEDRWDYVVGRMSPFVDFDVPLVFRRMNASEGLTDNPDCWGGSNICGGSARNAGSSTPPARMQEILNTEVAC